MDHPGWAILLAQMGLAANNGVNMLLNMDATNIAAVASFQTQVNTLSGTMRMPDTLIAEYDEILQANITGEDE